MSAHRMAQARQATHPQFMNEIVCSGCGTTGHITWDGTGETSRVIEMSESLTMHPGNPPSFTCANCGTLQSVLK